MLIVGIETFFFEKSSISCPIFGLKRPMVMILLPAYSPGPKELHTYPQHVSKVVSYHFSDRFCNHWVIPKTLILMEFKWNTMNLGMNLENFEKNSFSCHIFGLKHPMVMILLRAHSLSPKGPHTYQQHVSKVVFYHFSDWFCYHWVIAKTLILMDFK